MRVALGRRGDYSVRAVLDIATHWDGGRRKAREIAASMDIPQRFLGQILADLVRAELLVAVAGPDGGYSLARPPAEVTLLDVVEAAEGRVELQQCVLSGGPCDWVDVCPIHPAWSRAQQAFTEELRSTTFEQLAAADRAIEAGSPAMDRDAPAHPEHTERRGVR